MNILKLKKRFVKTVSVFTLVLTIAGSVFVALPQTAQAAVAQVSRQADGVTVNVNPATGFPRWYEDVSGGGGDRLQLCLGTNPDGSGPADPKCILPTAAPLEPNFPPPFVVNFPTSFPQEAFYWFAEAPLDINGNAGRFRIAVEAAFAGTGAVVNGQQTVFARASLFTSQAGAFPANGSYNVTYPFGSFSFTTDATGGMVASSLASPFQPNGGNAKEMRAEDGLLTPLDFTSFLPAANTNIGPFLKSTVAPVGYIGDGITEGPVTGGTNGNAVIITGSGIDLVTGLPVSININQPNWIIAGKIAPNIAPVIAAIAPQSALVGTPLNLNVTATDADFDPITFSVAPVAPAVGNQATATINPTTGAFSWTPDAASAVAGTASFTVTATDGITPSTATFTVTVTNPAPVLTSVNVTPPTAGLLPGGATTQITAAPLDQFGAAFVGATVTWSTNNAAVATVSNTGLVTSGATEGVAIITATAVSGATTVTGTSNITVATVPVLTTINVTPANPAVTVGGTQQMAAATLDQTGAPFTATVTWSSSNPLVATVDPATGAVTGVSIGTTTITATSGAVTGTSAITVATETVPPVITMLGTNPLNILIGTPYVDAGATALDDVSGDLTASIVTTGLPINTTATGTATVTYTVADAAGNTATATRTVNIVTDITAPVITVTGANPASLTVGGSYTDQGATALDDIDGDVTSRIQITNNVNAAVVGAYTVTYVVNDLAGNTATSTRTVNVNSAPASSGGGGGGGGGSFSPPTPTRIEATNVPLVISASQSGKTTYRFANGAQVEIEVPTGAVANTTTFSISQGAVAGNVPENTTGAFLINGQVFNITASSGSASVTTFSKQIEISLQVQGVPADIENVGVYYYDAPAGQWVLVPSTYDSANSQFTIMVDHLTEFAVIKATGKPATIKASQTPVTPTTPQTPGQVLGEKKYGDGNLIRGIAKKIYVIADGFKFPIHNLTELKKFAGRFIYDVDEGTLFAYPNGDKYPAKVLGMKIVNPLKGKSLIRTTDNKIFVVENGRRSHVKTLAELKKFAGLPITRVDNATLSGIPMAEDNPARANDDNGLVRGRDGKIFAIENGRRRHISSLTELRREHAGQAIRNVDDSTLNSFPMAEDNPARANDDNLPRNSGVDNPSRTNDDNLPQHSGADDGARNSTDD